ncbi:MAG: serine hydrolase [Bacteroidales bacterium]|nr:serine hydrolase [Bacteroidales bacterium]
MNTDRQRSTGRKVLYGILIFLVIAIISAAVYLNSLMPIITGYAAKNLCSAVFVSDRVQKDVEALDLNFSFISYVNSEVDRDRKTVTSRFLWGKSIAIYREGFGVTLLQEKTVNELKKIEFPDISPGYSSDTLAWPMGDVMPGSLHRSAALKKISDKLVNKQAYGGTAFAFMVVHKGVPVAEAYRDGMDKNTKLLSWSMAKSVTNALVGIMVKDGVIGIDNSDLLDVWSDDGRRDITIDNLMHMQSGLEWNEDYGNRSDVTLMLHCEPDFAEYTFTRPLEHEPGTHWYYSSGTSNIISYILRQQFNNDDQYYAFPHEQLFYRIGITDAIFEPDESGTLVGSSYLYMTARDYARFALLFLNDGVFSGERILPGGWVDYTVTPASDSNGGYGSFFWLNRDGGFESAPEDMFMCIGHDGQRIFLIPSLNMAVVILGYSPSDSMDFEGLLSDIIAALS